MGIFNTYPYTLPVNTDVLKAAILGTAGYYSVARGMMGEYFRFHLYLGPMIVRSTELFPAKEIPAELTFMVSQRRSGYRIVLEFVKYPNQRGIAYHSYTRYPFVFLKKKTKASVPQSLIMIRGSGSGFLLARRTARKRAARNYVPRQPSRRWNPKSQVTNPTVVSSLVPFRGYTNGTLSTSGSNLVESYKRSWNGVTTPSFILKKKRGLLPINNYSMTETIIQDNGFFEQAVGPSVNTFGHGAYAKQFGTAEYGNVPSSPSNPSTDFRAINKLIQAVGPKAGLAQNLVQMNQLTNMIAGTAKRLSTAISNTRKGNIPGAINALWSGNSPRFRKGGGPSLKKSVANNWLELQYGWKPLLQDVEESMHALAKYNLASVGTFTARSTAFNEKYQETKLVRNIAGRFPCGMQTQHTRWWVSYGIRYKADSHLTTLLAQSGFTNPISLIWEVLPYSFVVDWFLPVGPYLESFSAWDGVQFVDGWKSSMTKNETIYSVAYGGPNNGLANDPNVRTFGGSRTERKTEYSRVKLTAFPTQNMPSFKNPISVGHALNALALMTTAFRK